MTIDSTHHPAIYADGLMLLFTRLVDGDLRMLVPLGGHSTDYGAVHSRALNMRPNKVLDAYLPPTRSELSLPMLSIVWARVMEQVQ